MGRVRIKDKNKIPGIIKHAEELNNKQILVGIFGESAQSGHGDSDITMGEIAAIQEYGTRIQVTDKMRGYLASQGLPLKKSTTHITIPERSYIRAGWDEHEKGILDKAVNLLVDAIIEGKPSTNDALDAIGLEAEGKLQEFARHLNDPSNHPFTVDQKGSSNPLVDTGRLIGAITHEVL
ncbi:hypothetical protein [Peribacillus frigoritolerans]|uniref:hypothetical protein n=1 Tax=Peribacillus frigoritolerans TaxID=450367 RepID=UPI0022815D25|nr:hypothetical protein [Peribacillus frigoritolerans]MCY9007191.1 hypothetical protein [Peribacillus frigoritolerans]